MLVAGRNPEAPGGPMAWILLLSSFFLLLRFTDVLPLRSQGRVGQGFDSLGSSYAYEANTALA